ncbi:uncharacterized protein TNCV_3150211 [Trichonephila clavipes]|nr:uncharacterized protein TNCV_3150211 [Trichonephila clavipes]
MTILAARRFCKLMAHALCTYLRFVRDRRSSKSGSLPILATPTTNSEHRRFYLDICTVKTVLNPISGQVFDAGHNESGVFLSAEWHDGDWLVDGIREATPCRDWNKWCMKSRIRLSIVFNKFRLTRYVYQPKFASVEMFSYIGGYMGMWLGLSLISLFDLLETICYLFFYPVGRMTAKRKKRSVKPEPVKNAFLGTMY